MTRLAAWVAAALVLTLTGAVAVAAPGLRANVRPAWDDRKILTILVIGSDVGPPQRPGNPLRGRADAVQLVTVNTRKNKATVVSIPRDSLIGGRKVNAHLSSGGPKRLRRVLADYTGLKIDYYAVTSFQGLKGMVNAMGGIQVDVTQRMKSVDAKSDFKPGRQRMNGKQALAFTRDRKSVQGGDFGRTRHQGQMLLFAHRQIRKHQSDPVSLMRLAGAFLSNVETDIPRHRLIHLAGRAIEIPPKNIRHIALSGGTGFRGPESVVFLNPGSTFADLRKGKVGR